MNIDPSKAFTLRRASLVISVSNVSYPSFSNFNSRVVPVGLASLWRMGVWPT